MTQPQGYVLTRDLPPIPAKRYFTIGEVSQLCDVRSYVLRYWEQEFVQLRPMKRRGNRRYYQLHEVQLVRKIRELLYEQGFTIAGARLQLEQKAAEDVMSFELSPPDVAAAASKGASKSESTSASPAAHTAADPSTHIAHDTPAPTQAWVEPADVSDMNGVLEELRAISALLRG
jgi:DNA-binding transcriptional MerR regulator